MVGSGAGWKHTCVEMKCDEWGKETAITKRQGWNLDYDILYLLRASYFKWQALQLLKLLNHVSNGRVEANTHDECPEQFNEQLGASRTPTALHANGDSLIRSNVLSVVVVYGWHHGWR